MNNANGKIEYLTTDLHKDCDGNIYKFMGENNAPIAVSFSDVSRKLGIPKSEVRAFPDGEIVLTTLPSGELKYTVRRS